MTENLKYLLYFFMRLLLTINILLLSLLSFGQIPVIPFAHTGSESEDVMTIDMRQGLSESRIRALCPLPDGRMAIATAAYMNIFDGVTFATTRIENTKGIPLRSSGKARQISHDSMGNIWLKMPATQVESVETIHVYDPINCEDVTLEVIPQDVRNRILDVYVDDVHQIWIVDTLLNLNKFDGELLTPITNIKGVNDELPYTLTQRGGKLYLCYEDASVCVIDASSDMLVYKGAPVHPIVKMLQSNAGAKWSDGKLFTSYHHDSGRKEILISSLDTSKWEWDTISIKRLIHDYLVTENGEVIIGYEGVDDEIFRVTLDGDSGLWIGTRENGILYSNPQRQHLVKISHSPYPYSRSRNYVSNRAATLGHNLAPGGVNCSDEDSISGYLYLGTSNGLIILDSLNNKVALLAKNVGLPGNGIQSVLVTPYTGLLRNDSTASIHEVWFTTTTTLSRLRHINSERYDVLTLGFLDGLSLDGSELYPQMLTQDSIGRIVTGYPGGTVTVNPADIRDENYVIHHYPDNKVNIKDDREASGFVILLIIIVVLIIASIAIIYLTRRRKSSHVEIGSSSSLTGTEVQQESASPQPKASARSDMERKYESMVAKYNEEAISRSGQVSVTDNEFVIRLNNIILEHIGDEELSVVTLSQDMAMDRTNLYRKMQTSLGKSPSVYIKEIRLSTAAKLLRETEMPIPEIARQTGFSSSKYFSTTFKESFGLLPNKYRQANKPS